MRAFRSLQARLTLNYALVTTVASVLILALFFLGIGALIFNTDELPLALARATAGQAAEARERLLTADPASVTRWLGDIERQDEWLLINQPGLQYGVNLGAQGDAVLALYDARGQQIGTTPAVGAPDPIAAEADLIARATKGEIEAERLFAVAGDVMTAAAPMIDERGRVVGVVVARAWRWPTNPLLLWGVAVVSSVLPALCFVLPAALVIGLVFGFFTARGLTRRITAVADASAAWSAGDFSRSLSDRSGDELGQLASRLNAMARELQSLVDMRQALAVSEERNRLALELHDSVKQQAFAASAQLAAARTWLEREPAQAEPRLREAERLLDELRQELAALILELRPPALEGRTLPEALREYVGDWSRQTGLAAEFQAAGTEALTPATEQALLRITQEALANCLRHSGAARVTVTLALAKPVTLIIADDGRGFDPDEAPRGLGLNSMRERVGALGGTLDLVSAPQAGTRLTIQIPPTA